MLQLIRDTIRRIQRGTFVGNGSMSAAGAGAGARAVDGLVGIAGKFAELCDPKKFTQVLYPGAPPSVLETKPASLRDLLLVPELVVDVTAACRGAAQVLTNVLKRGAASGAGETMDAQTRAILCPQIAQESLARVRNACSSSATVQPCTCAPVSVLLRIAYLAHFFCICYGSDLASDFPPTPTPPLALFNHTLLCIALTAPLSVLPIPAV